VSELDDILRHEAHEARPPQQPPRQNARPQAPLCAYRVGGPAEFLYRAETTGALAHAVKTAREVGVPVTVLGRATNVLVGDAGLAGLAVLARNAAHTLDGELLMVEAGAELPGLITALAEQGLAGLEFAGNIPGSVGGAVVGNAGAYGRAVSDALVDVHLLDGTTEHVKDPWELDFGYRTSLFKRLPELTVLSATFQLHRGERSALLDEIARDAELRRSKHPLEYASCGSYFKNPSRKLPAARLIEDAGLKGFSNGRARVSERHANFLVALPGATTADIVALAAEIKRRVCAQSGYELEEEVRRLGF
jgi:UDP-N-acetylmuramate dehydrogenase